MSLVDFDAQIALSCRLAIVRFVNGDTPGAERDLWRHVSAAPADEREDLLLEAYEIAHALLTRHPALAYFFLSPPPAGAFAPAAGAAAAPPAAGAVAAAPAAGAAPGAATAPVPAAAAAAAAFISSA